MKRLMIMVMMTMIMVAASAKTNPLRLQSGTLTPLKGKGGSIVCEFDFSRTRGNRKPLEQHLSEDFDSSIEEFNSKIPSFWKWFSDRWNDDIEEGPHITKDNRAPLVMKLIIKNLQMGAKSGYGGVSISGYAQFYREGETVPFAVVEILKLTGTQMGISIAGYPGLQQAFNDLAEYLCDLIYHY